MAESKGALIAKTVQKHAGRAKEKVSTTKRHIHICNRFLQKACQSFIRSERICSFTNYLNFTLIAIYSIFLYDPINKCYHLNTLMHSLITLQAICFFHTRL